MNRATTGRDTTTTVFVIRHELNSLQYFSGDVAARCIFELEEEGRKANTK